MIFLYTDFGVDDPYVGQLHGVLTRHAPGVPVVDLLHNVPRFDARAGAYLLAALAEGFDAGDIIVGVVDPGVGGPRYPLLVEADGRCFIGPDNGLFAIAARRANDMRCYRIEWRPRNLSDSFHGRDLFAPVAAVVARGLMPEPLTELGSLIGSDWPDDLERVIYVDHYGNAVTGVRATRLERTAVLTIKGIAVAYARTFHAAPGGHPFWYENSIGLVEIAVNRGSAADRLGIAVGDALETPVP